MKDLGNWWPVTLLCTDCKVLGKVLANRAKKVLEEVLGPDQACGVPGRMGSQNLILLRDVLSWARSGFRGNWPRPTKGLLVPHSQVPHSGAQENGFRGGIHFLGQGPIQRGSEQGESERGLEHPGEAGKGGEARVPTVTPVVCIGDRARQDRVFVGLQIPGGGGAGGKGDAVRR